MLRELNLEGLSKFAEGTVEATFNQHLRRAIEDCEDRPGEKKERTVSLVVNLIPDTTQDGALVDVKVDASITYKIPKHISRTVHCNVKVGGRAIFNDMAPEQAHQRTIDQIEGVAPDPSSAEG